MVCESIGTALLEMGSFWGCYSEIWDGNVDHANSEIPVRV